MSDRSKDWDPVFRQMDKAFAEADRAFEMADKAFDAERNNPRTPSSTTQTEETIRFNTDTWRARGKLFWKFFTKALQALFTGRTTLAIKRK